MCVTTDCVSGLLPSALETAAVPQVQGVTGRSRRRLFQAPCGSVGYVLFEVLVRGVVDVLVV